MTERQRWNAVVACDRSYDGVFYYAVRTTGIYCRPSCPSKTPLRKHVHYFPAGEDAVRAGYRPCKRCRPDEAAKHPAVELTDLARKLIDERFANDDALSAGIQALGVSRHRLDALFKARFDMTPCQYTRNVRVVWASAALCGTEDSVTHIAHAAGFESLPAFYRAFHKYAKVSPTAYRSAHTGKEGTP